MADSRLNSFHLVPARRQEFRRAREALLHARGSQTLFQSCQSGASQMGHTVIRPDQETKGEFSCWLSDGEFLYPLKVGVNTLGRSSDNDVIVEDGYTSRRHCAILVHAGDSYELHDTASKNGTYLNGSRIIAPALLKSGDEIRISKQQFLFVTLSGTPVALAPQATLSS